MALMTKHFLACFAFHVRFLQRYVQKETEGMQSSKSNVTATTLATRKKKMAEMCSLIKYFIRYANKRKDTLSARSSSRLQRSFR